MPDVALTAPQCGPARPPGLFSEFYSALPSFTDFELDFPRFYPYLSSITQASFVQPCFGSIFLVLLGLGQFYCWYWVEPELFSASPSSIEFD